MKWILEAFAAGFISAKKLLSNDKKIKEVQSQLEKITFYYQILNMWMEMKQKSISTVSYLQKKGIEKVAIYGMKELGERLYEELKSTDIEVACIIDKNPEQVLGDFIVISPDDRIPKVDAIIVTANYYYLEIAEELKEKVDCPIYSLNGILGNSFGRNL